MKFRVINKRVHSVTCDDMVIGVPYRCVKVSHTRNTNLIGGIFWKVYGTSNCNGLINKNFYFDDYFFNKNHFRFVLALEVKELKDKSGRIHRFQPLTIDKEKNV